MNYLIAVLFNCCTIQSVVFDIRDIESELNKGVVTLTIMVGI